jgi:hypothetical protein
VCDGPAWRPRCPACGVTIGKRCAVPERPRSTPLYQHSGALSVAFAVLSYTVVLHEALAFDIVSKAPTFLRTCIVCVAAQVVSVLELTAAERLFGKPIHSIHCRQDQTVFALIAWICMRGKREAILAAAFTYMCCPHLLLWLPIKRRKAAAASEQLSIAVGQPSSEEVEATEIMHASPLAPTSRRYLESFWGLAWIGHLRLGLEWGEPLHQCTGCGVEVEVGAVDPDGGLWSSLPLCRHNSMWQMSPPDRLDCHSSASRSPKGVARLGSCFERFQYLRRRKNAYLAMSVRRKQVLPTVPRNSIGRKGYAARELLP